MRLFRKRNKDKRQPANWLIQLRQCLEQRQLKLAGFLSRRTQYWNRLSWIIALVSFILLFGGCCLFLCIKAFIHFK